VSLKAPLNPTLRFTEILKRKFLTLLNLNLTDVSNKTSETFDGEFEMPAKMKVGPITKFRWWEIRLNVSEVVR
jgi:hypothetical protein